MDTPNVEFYFDVASPYSYLASTQIGDLCERLGCAATWRPMLLEGVFKASGNRSPIALSAKASHLIQDLTRWAAVYGVPFHMPSSFPANSLLAMRVLSALQERGDHAALRAAAHALFRRQWDEGEDISNAEDIGAALATTSLDVDALLERAALPVVKLHLRAATEQAVARGVFGAPTLFVQDQMFFGNDRLMLLEATYPDGVPSARLIAPTEGPLTMDET